MAAPPAAAAVARVAYLASDHVVDVRQRLAAPSDAAQACALLREAGARNLLTDVEPEVEAVLASADPLLSAHAPAAEGKLVTVIADSSLLLMSVPHLYQLARHPVVLHLSLANSDYSQIAAVRQCGFSFLHSQTADELQHMSLTAHALAARTGTGVIHFYDTAQVALSPAKAPLLPEDDIKRFFAADATRLSEPLQPSTANGFLYSQAPNDTKQLSPAEIINIANDIWTHLESIFGPRYTPFQYSGKSNAKYALVSFGPFASTLGRQIMSAETTDQYSGCGFISIRLYRPWTAEHFNQILPASVERLAVLEQIRHKTTKWGSLLIDVLSSTSSRTSKLHVVGFQLGEISEASVRQALNGIFSNLQAPQPLQNLRVGTEPELSTVQRNEKPGAENAYYKMLDQVFMDRLYVANDQADQYSSSVEFGLGVVAARQERRVQFVKQAQAAAQSTDFATNAPNQWLSRWALTVDDAKKSQELKTEIVQKLRVDASSLASQLLKDASLLNKESQWIIGSDSWSYDLGNSGVHHLLASGRNANILVIDSTPYSKRAAANAARRKKDIGLYAMNFGNAYVASVAVYSSYTQVLEALIEADSFEGPSVVVAYLPFETESDSPVKMLQETKNAVDSGYWPLYRWRPAVKESEEPVFHLDSERAKKELEEFLARENHMTSLMRRQPEFASNLSASYGSEVREQQKRRAKDAYSQLLDSLVGAPLTILFASDNGNAEGLAKRLGNRGRARGLKTMVMAMDDYPLEDLSKEENVVLLTSTAGQGEFPQNGRNFWETLKGGNDLTLENTKVSVFALGDSHYWPRKQDKVYYNKPGKDLFNKLKQLNAQILCDLGLGDDQDPDSYQTGYEDWEPKVWQALGVDKVEGLPEEPAPLTNEDMKIQSNYLRGTIKEGLEDETTGAISASDQQLTKFHGTYMQDDRDVRDERKAQGMEPAYSFMIRCRLPGGIATPQQWMQMDDIANELGNDTMKLTTRQTFQFHGVIKKKLRPAMQAINKALMTTIAACGDVNRNVMCSSLPEKSGLHRDVYKISHKISDHLLPSTTAYHEIWLKDDDGKKTQLAGDAVVDHEPLYGPTYLPRKFKITIAIPPHNDTDVFAHDIGLIAIKDNKGGLRGFDVLIGGGMGTTHNNKKTYPRTGSMLGFCSPEDVHVVCEKIMLVQRDNGDRKNRKHARLKYTVDDMGEDVFKEKVEELWGKKFQDTEPFYFESNIDTFGWITDETGNSHFTMFIENGRVEDTPKFQMKTGLREIAKVHKGEFRLTGNQHLILSNVPPSELDNMKQMLAKYGLDNTNFTGLRLSSSACVAFPTCGLAMAESERYLPELITKLEQTLEENGLSQDSIVMRMTGCPNGCARPWLAEVAFVGKAYGAYNMYLGGGYHGHRLNKLYRSSIKEDEILDIMKGLLKRWAAERNEGEHFGDFCIRAGIIAETRRGLDFHENTGEEEDDEE